MAKAVEIPLMGLEPTIFELEVQRLIHWATGADEIGRQHHQGNQ